jgi:hypothetical protein
MLSNIVTLWPPRPSPQQPETGTKTLGEENTTLTDLHEPAWWTGLKLAAGTRTGRVEDASYWVRLLRADGKPVFDGDAHTCEWVQNVSTWHAFPWPIPAAMAKAVGARLEITAVDPDNAVFMVATACFHELDRLDTNDMYVFTDEQDYPVHLWNGRQQADGSKLRGDLSPSGSRVPHVVIPPTRLISVWSNNLRVRVNTWNRPLRMD